MNRDGRLGRSGSARRYSVQEERTLRGIYCFIKVSISTVTNEQNDTLSGVLRMSTSLTWEYMGILTCKLKVICAYYDGLIEKLNVSKLHFLHFLIFFLHFEFLLFVSMLLYSCYVVLSSCIARYYYNVFLKINATLLNKVLIYLYLSNEKRKPLKENVYKKKNWC